MKKKKKSRRRRAGWAVLSESVGDDPALHVTPCKISEGQHLPLAGRGIGDGFHPLGWHNR